MTQKLDYSKLDKVLLYQDTQQAKDWRNKEWKILDMNGNGDVSLSEFETWIRHYLPEFFNNGNGQNYKIAFRYAYNKARTIHKSKATATSVQKKIDNDYLTKDEFAPMLKFTRMFLEIFSMFDELDTSDDGKLQLGEFTHGVNKLNQWGAKIGDPKAEFMKIDANNSGSILYSEFLLYALDKNLDEEIQAK
ncbi:Flagellar_calcium-binding protein [Hexamita inflata]|uniref:Flagellar calcium-binding protein n=1 Tax=Hexamita inflata TaxID=28002 RepID=A0AA86UZA0_9EUKA|nr:Flagellar calcium-binding protein [Hexamita inflata]